MGEYKSNSFLTGSIMKKRNIWKNIDSPLQLKEDQRGKIVDIFYKENINHVAVINSKAGTQRGNHYHKHTIQHILITKGVLEYWYKPLNSNIPAKWEILREGDLLTTPSFEVHALKIIEDNQFIVFAQGLRGGKDYESDTYRVSPSIIMNNN